MEKSLIDVHLKFPEAKRLAELFAISDDLKYVFHTGNLFNHYSQRQPNDLPYNPYDENNLVSRSMWNAMLIAYARCFATGIRHGLTPQIFDIHPKSSELKKSHKYFIDMRSKDIAHSINSSESSETIAALSDIGDEHKKVETIACYGIRYIGGDQEVKVLCTLAGIAHEYVQQQYNSLHKIVLQKANEIPIEKLYKYPRSKFTVKGFEEAGNPRTKD